VQNRQALRVLIVKLSSMGDVIHTLPVVQDIRRAYPKAVIDWVVEPAFAPLVRRAEGIGEVIEAPFRNWTKAWWAGWVRSDFMALRHRLRREHYDAVIDLQGLTKSAIVSAMARGHRYAIGNRTDGSGYELPTRLVAKTAIAVEPRIHALDRSRIVAAKALGYRIDREIDRSPDFGLRAEPKTGASPGSKPAQPQLQPPTVAFLHGASRADKLWPERDWIALGRLMINEGWRVALPQGSPAEGERATRLAAALGPKAIVWPLMPLGSLMDKMAACQGAIGVDSGLSHLAVALDLPHVQIYNFPTAWRTGPRPEHGHHHQISLEPEVATGLPPSLESVHDAWRAVLRKAVARSGSDSDLMGLHIHANTQAMTQASNFADDDDLEPSGVPSRQPPAPPAA
jgi:heptosyltransferase-1